MARNQKAVGLNLQRKTLYLTEELDALVRRDAYQKPDHGERDRP